MHKAHIMQHQLRKAVAAQTEGKPAVTRETLKLPIKPPLATPSKTIKSKDKKIVKGQICE